MNPQENFSSSMQEASVLFAQLIELLHEERISLTQNDASQTQAILERKTELLLQLEQNTQQRNQILLAQGFKPDETGSQAFFDSLPPEVATEFTTSWQSLQAQLEECKAENMINGKVIHRSRQQVDTLLSMLHGNQNNDKIYTDSGQAKNVNAQQPLAKA